MSLLLLLRRRTRLAVTGGGGGGGGKHGDGHQIDPFEHLRAELIQQQNKVIVQLMLSMAASGALR